MFKYILIFMATMHIFANATTSLSNEEIAARDIPVSDVFYSKEILLEKFERVMLPKPYEYLGSFLNVIFLPEFPEPVHSNLIISKGWNCLYTKMLESQRATDPVQAQITAIQKLMFLHRESLTTHAPDLVATLPADLIACAACVGFKK